MNTYNLLIVDDEPNILKALQRLFRGSHLSVITADTAEHALEILRTHEVQVLITDNLMPSMTGVALIKTVKECSPDTIRLILSGQSDVATVLKAVNEGEAFRFILKPWDDTDLRITVNIALAHYKLNQDNKALIERLKERDAVLRDIFKHHPEVFGSVGAGSECSLESASQASHGTPINRYRG